MLTDDLNALHARFRSQWPSNIRVEYDNQPAIAPLSGETWARFHIEPSSGERRTFGAGGLRSQLGRVMIQIFVPVGSADGEAASLATTAAAIFNEWVSSDFRLRCDLADYRTDQDEHWYWYTVSTAWESIR
jgi:hypothetical protein